MQRSAPNRFLTYSSSPHQHDGPNRAQHSRAHLHHGQGKIIAFIIAWGSTTRAAQPDGVDRGLIGEILSRFEKRGFKLIAAKLARPPRAQLEKRLFPFFFLIVIDCLALSPF